MNIVKFNGKEYDLKAARSKAIPVITVTKEQISDLDVEIIGQYESREDEMHVVVPHEGRYVFITGRPKQIDKEMKVKLLTKYNLKKAELNDAEVVEAAERQAEKTKHSVEAKTFSRKWRTQSEH